MTKAIFLYGSSCAGKSTLVKSMLEKSSNMFHLNIDKIKWLISDYNNQNNSYLNTLDEMLVSLAKTAIKNEMNIIYEGKSPYIFNKLESFLKELDIKVYQINLEAPLEILKERFLQRLKDVEINGGKVSNKSLDRFIEIYNEYIDTKKEDILTLDSSILSKEEMILELEKLVNS
ncbi:MAG: zeta toxin family protein [Candidatus Gracilibacteria bacterium]|nr:zeta toxin family protein [Candidatus Gracilibacteria bacterium]